MSLDRRTPRVSQPQSAPQVSNGRAPSFIWTPTGGVDREIISGKPASFVDNDARLIVTGQHGLAVRGGVTSVIRWPSTTFAASTSYTVMAMVIDDTGRGVIRNPFDADDANIARVFQFRLTASNAVQLITFDTAGTPYFATGTTATPATEKSVIFGRISNNELSVWLNGKQDATGSASGTPRTIQTSGAQLSIGSNVSNTQPFGGQIYLCAHWPFALSDAEIASISANPWQLFAPEPRRLFVPAAVGGGATTITCTVGAASAVGVSGFVNTALQANVGAAAAAGVTASVNRTLQTSVAASSATGVTSLVSRTLQASVGAAAATGVTAQLATTVSAGPGNASAAGVNAVINTAGNTTIACSVGAASAVGVAALANTTLQTAVGAASGQGVLARLNVTLQTGVGAASAVGVSFSSGGVIYIPALLQFTSPSRAQTFTSPSRLQSFTSPARSGP